MCKMVLTNQFIILHQLQYILTSAYISAHLCLSAANFVTRKSRRPPPTAAYAPIGGNPSSLYRRNPTIPYGASYIMSACEWYINSPDEKKWLVSVFIASHLLVRQLVWAQRSLKFDIRGLMPFVRIQWDVQFLGISCTDEEKALKCF